MALLLMLRNYACQPNAEKEIAVFTIKRLPKVQYHRVDFQIVEEEKRGRGRPKKNQTENAAVIGPGKVKMTRPTLRAIVVIFGYAPINRYSYEGQVSRALLEPLNDSEAKILRYLGIPTNIFTAT